MTILSDTIKDIYYPKPKTPYKIRKGVKGIILDKDNNIYLIHIKGTDMFGPRDHYELPGGGLKENENNIEALKREIKEELGFIVKDIEEIGSIGIEYNLLNRIDENCFYSAYIDSYTNTALEEYEKELFKEIVKVNISDILSFYLNHEATLVGEMIHRRDLIVIQNYINKKEKENGN